MASKIPTTDLPIHHMDAYTYKLSCGATGTDILIYGHGCSINIHDVTCPKCKEIIDGRNTRSK